MAERLESENTSDVPEEGTVHAAKWGISPFTRRLFVVVLVVGLALLLWQIANVVILLFPGIPLAPVLGLIAGVSEFVPIIGPILSAIPAIPVAFVQGPTQAFYVLLLYVGIQQAESYLVTPLVQEQGASLPPTLMLLAITIFGTLFGLLGIVVATPLMVVVYVLAKLLYVEGGLGSATNVPGHSSL